MSEDTRKGVDEYLEQEVDRAGTDQARAADDDDLLAA